MKWIFYAKHILFSKFGRTKLQFPICYWQICLYKSLEFQHFTFIAIFSSSCFRFQSNGNYINSWGWMRVASGLTTQFIFESSNPNPSNCTSTHFLCDCSIMRFFFFWAFSFFFFPNEIFLNNWNFTFRINLKRHSAFSLVFHMLMFSIM